jgi:acyl-CoA reductase-like NAD-dependent aldehyde dehydrogenase
VSAIDYTLRRLPRWTRPRRVALEWPHWFASGRLLPCPRGVAGIIGPSNYPLQLALMPLLGALGAGCRTLVKPSEATPTVASLLRSTLAMAIDPEIATAVCGDAAAAARLSALPLDVLLFTGSSQAGHRVALAAAGRLTPVILELGGKSPVIVDRGAPLAPAASAIVRGKLLNAGQTCVAPDYVLVPREDLARFVRQLCESARTLYPQPECGDYGALLTEAAHIRLQRLEAGTDRVRLFATAVGPPRYDPKLILAPPLDGAVMQEEIFGPLLPIVPYDELEEALAVINALPPALVLYWFGASNSRLAHTIERTVSGAVSVNETVLHAGISALPFGGVGASGMGRYHGRAGFDAFSHERPLFRQSRFNLTSLVRPPYGPRAETILRRLLR